MQTLAVEGFNIIGWVRLWYPIELHMYKPIPIFIESRVYTFLNSLVLEVQPQRHTIITAPAPILCEDPESLPSGPPL
jgi:hypothetical protein